MPYTHMVNGKSVRNYKKENEKGDFLLRSLEGKIKCFCCEYPSNEPPTKVFSPLLPRLDRASDNGFSINFSPVQLGEKGSGDEADKRS